MTWTFLDLNMLCDLLCPSCVFAHAQIHSCRCQNIWKNGAHMWSFPDHCTMTSREGTTPSVSFRGGWLCSFTEFVTSVVKNAVFFSAMSHIVDGIDALSDANWGNLKCILVCTWVSKELSRHIMNDHGCLSLLSTPFKHCGELEVMAF